MRKFESKTETTASGRGTSLKSPVTPSRIPTFHELMYASMSETLELTRIDAFFALGTELCVEPPWLSFFTDSVILQAVNSVSVLFKI
jgi:hypothetical protein